MAMITAPDHQNPSARLGRHGDRHVRPPSLAVVWALNVFSMARTWRERDRFRRELAARTEHELQDMGTCWSSISDEVSKPFWRA
jgi:uncharacterized protein YjiS (DUF1127 family)